MPRFTVTYETVSPESADAGDYESIGFVLPGGWLVPIDEALADKESDYKMSLREAADLASPDEDSGRWLSETGESRMDYGSGIFENRSIHPPENITASSYKRLKRLFNVR